MEKTGDKAKTKAQLIEELQALRQQLAELRGREDKGREQVEESPLRERDMLHVLMENVPDWIFFKDAESRIVRSNRAHAQLLGFDDPQEVVGKTDFDLFPREDAQRFYDEEQRMLQSGQSVVARLGQTPSSDGEVLWVSETKIPLKDETGQVIGLVGISRDVTDIKRAEETLKEAHTEIEKQVEERTAELKQEIAERERAEEALAYERDLLQALMDNSPDYLFFKDRESRFIRTNKAHAQLLLGLSNPQEAVGKTDFDLFPGKEEDTQRFYDEEQMIMETRQPVIAREWQVPSTTTGEIVWLSEHKVPLTDRTGQVVGLLGLGRDITERKQAEEALERRAVQLQAAAEVSEAVGSILDPGELIPRIVELVRKRFDLYYVGLFLVEDDQAVLHAGTGKAGQRMLEARHKLEVGGESMIGWCVANKKARIALDVGEEAVRFDNPLLPETRSELALPLVSRGEVIGALSTQSTKEAAFTDEDIAVLQTMADQVANAIANARLYDEAHRERSLLQALLNNSPDYIFFKDRESRFIRTNKAHAQNLLGVSDPREIEGKTDFDLFPGKEEDTQRFYDEEQMIMETRQPVIAREWQVPSTTTSEIVWLSEHKMPLTDRTGQVVGLLGLSRDITARKQAEEALERRAVQLQAAADVSSVAGSALDPDELIQRVVNLIRERFDLYYVGLFLVNEIAGAKYAVLRAGTGEAGRRMVKQRHELRVSKGHSMTGDCIATGEARVEQDVTKATMHRRNPLLPDTRSELALPLISRGEAIGALTVQSAEPLAFTEEDISILQTMAGQVANAIENTRLYKQTEDALKELETIHRSYIRRSWDNYIKRRGG